MKQSVLGIVAGLTLILPVAFGGEEARDKTCFQIFAPYNEAVDIGSDMAVVYGVDNTFADRVARWREKGYAVGMMTGIAWGNYDDYYQTENGFRKDEVQTDKNGKLFMHGDSTTVGYNVPTPSYVEYIKKKIDPAIDAGVQAIFFEEPEYWAQTGWSAAFKKEWERLYGEPWQAPDSSVDAQYRASKLKYTLYFEALREVTHYVKERAKALGRTIECHVPTHTLINYAQWRIVSPESHLMDIPDMDGYIAQVWTGTARTPNRFRGVRKSRTFEMAFLEYGQALSMVRPTGRKVWFLADPVEDNPNHSWNDYKLNYECTLIASLMWPEVDRFEVMPWPDRIFQGQYPKVDLDAQSSAREGIPADYATEILTLINALNDMGTVSALYDTGSRGIGVLVSDTMMFQRAEPQPSDPELGGFFGLAMPLVKAGLLAEVVQLENVLNSKTLEPYHTVLLTYEGQKPLDPRYHEALAAWVRGGGTLIYVGDGADPYHHVREWWNQQGVNTAKPEEDLFLRLGIDIDACSAPAAVGSGQVLALRANPADLAQQAGGADQLLDALKAAASAKGKTLNLQNCLKIQRGPYVIAAVLDESVSEAPLEIEGHFVDLFDPRLGVLKHKTLKPDQRALLYDLDWLKKQKVSAKVAAASGRIRNERVDSNVFRFSVRGPVNALARMRIALPTAPEKIRIEEGPDLPWEWDAESSTVWLEFPHQARDLGVEIRMKSGG